MLARQPKFQRSLSQVQPFGGMTKPSTTGFGHLIYCPREQAMISREVKIVIALPHHHFFQSCMNELCFCNCEKGTPRSV